MRTLFAAMLCLCLSASLLAATDKPAAPTAPASAQVMPAQVDINRASLDELKALKGIGEARAAAIVKGRPYGRKDDLVRRGIVPEAVYKDIRERIIARQ